jgi:hypothetical protein
MIMRTHLTCASFATRLACFRVVASVAFVSSPPSCYNAITIDFAGPWPSHFILFNQNSIDCGVLLGESHLDIYEY